MNKLLLAALVITMGASCSSRGQENNHVRVSPLSNNVDIQANDNNGAFDVNALADLVKKSTDPATLEQQINNPDNNVNNLDLDKDGKVDFLTVTETGKNQLEVRDAAVDPATLVARMTVTPDNATTAGGNSTASLQIEGTPMYCGPAYHYYQPHISLGTMLFMAYLLRPHAYYVPMWGYGRYPTYYSSTRTVVRTTYRPTTSRYAPVQRNYTSSRPAYNRSSLSRPMTSARSFGVRNTSRPVSTGGFGNSRRTGGFGSSSRSSSYSSPRSSYSPSRSSFGSSRSSFGRSYSGSSYGSRSYSGSRSFGSSRSSFGGSRSSGRSFGRRR